jgi:uncharacterized membrane protein YoaK (UPF0700 family)
MLSARAYSFRQKSRLAISLSWIGGYTNVVAFLSCGSVVSHVTGTATKVGETIGGGHFMDASFFVFLLHCFFIGAVISAFMTEFARRRGNPSKYVLPIAVEALLLTVYALVCNYHGSVQPADWVWRYALTGLAATAMGLQNATITKISGSVVRTTHLTGVITDLALEGVQFLLWLHDNMRHRWATRPGRLARTAQRNQAFLRLLLLASIFISFLLGATVGTAVFIHWPTTAMVPPVMFLGWIIVIDWRRPIADVRELDLVSDPELRAQGIIKAMLPPEVGLYRFGCHRTADHHRAPNLQLWVDRLPARWRVIILAVSPLTRFDANAVLDLETAVKKLHSDGRKLIMCGLTGVQLKSLDDLGLIRMLNVYNICPDLEFAIARGIALIQQSQTETETLHRSRHGPALTPATVAAQAAP